MPNRNGTGPLGAGPATGRAMGRCAGQPADPVNPGRGRGLGWRGQCGRPGGGGACLRFHGKRRAASDPAGQDLERRIEAMESRLEALKSQGRSGGTEDQD
jgi:hypothetical protein